MPSLMCKCRPDPFFQCGCKVPSILFLGSQLSNRFSFGTIWLFLVADAFIARIACSHAACSNPRKGDELFFTVRINVAPISFVCCCVVLTSA